MSMLSDDMDATKRAELAQQVKAANDAADAQIKEFLGDDNFAQFQDYDKSTSEWKAPTRSSPRGTSLARL